MTNDEDFDHALACVPVCWHRELRFARSWSDSIAIEWDDREEPVGCVVFAKGGREYAFLIGDDCWDADDPRSEMIESLISEVDRMTPVVEAAIRCRDDRWQNTDEIDDAVIAYRKESL